MSVHSAKNPVSLTTTSELADNADLLKTIDGAGQAARAVPSNPVKTVTSKKAATTVLFTGPRVIAEETRCARGAAMRVGPLGYGFAAPGLRDTHTDCKGFIPRGAPNMTSSAVDVCRMYADAKRREVKRSYALDGGPEELAAQRHCAVHDEPDSTTHT